MHSPFYESEQKRLYPYRTSAKTPEEIALEINNLIEIGIETDENISKTPIGTIRLKYFVQSDEQCWNVLEGLRIYDKKYKR